ncbi:MAG: hypothetical protein Q9213_008174 [Squamulea squamosa]
MDLDEAPLPSQSPTNITTSDPNLESDSENDAPLDFRHLIPTNNHALPRRGVKDFEYHGTNSQISVLEGSRQAMHEALGVGRLHGQKSSLVGYFDLDCPGEESGVGEEDGMSSGGTKKERPVVVEKPLGQHIRTMGMADKNGGLWLLPEEVVYLVERASLDVRYRATIQEHLDADEKLAEGDNKDGGSDTEGEVKGWDGISMSLQACYAHFIGCDGLTLERYTVYAALRRSGYIVQRAPGWNGAGSEILQPTPLPPQTLSTEKPRGQNIWQWLYTTLLAQEPRKPSPLGPLVTPGLYRNYSDIYRFIHLIPSYTPSPIQYPQMLHPAASLPPSNPFSSGPPALQIHFNIHKPNPRFRKTAPGPPDYHICVINAREEDFPTLSQLDGLLNSVPYDPPLEGEKRLYQRLKHGYRNVLLAVVDQGIVSFIRVADAAFANEKLYERNSRPGQGSKRGGGTRGRGRGRGRGRYVHAHEVGERNVYA